MNLGKMLRHKMLQEVDKRFFSFGPKEIKEGESSYFLITVPYGIGDAIYLGLSAADQILKNMPEAHGRIDFLCNTLQSEVLSCDPRLNKIIVADRNLCNCSLNIKTCHCEEARADEAISLDKDCHAPFSRSQ